MASRSDDRGSAAPDIQDGGSGDGSAFAFGNERQGRSRGSQRSGGGNAQRLVRTLGKQSNWLRGQAGEKIRQFADSGKEQVNGRVDTLLGLVDETVRIVDDRFGPQAGGYARQAADQVSSYAGAFRDRSAEDLLEDSRTLIRKQPLAAFGIAVLVGLAAARIVEAGLQEEGSAGTQGTNQGENA